MSIPLVQKAEKDDINTSIIAIKRNIERINMLLGLIDSGGSDPDLSGLATKQELQNAVESLQPVDEVTIDNMQSVTSNAVAEAINGDNWETVDGIDYKRIGKIVFIRIWTGVLYFPGTGQYARSVSTGNDMVVPEKYRPSKEVNSFVCWNSDDTIFRFRINTDGRIKSWNLGSLKTLPVGSNNNHWQSSFSYCID